MDTFTRAYLEAALWTSDPEPRSGEWSESDVWNIEAIAPHSLRQAVSDCEDFQQANAADLAQAGDDAQNGHDFWLTRNRHGAGFWDRGYGDVGRRLTDAAHVYGEVYVNGPELDDQGCADDAAFDAWDGTIYLE
jgi:hypothetical protein